ncbi:hypothetical protein Pst134EA_003221 [Puccinia striiformis f. sp. tritici]|uniref:hypothetical protein n=1 Tax=Puccinia striiformis f. sp. tritici TaxID=168172 RepID=UPI0020084577|nr:hypothetical protein Pst134EA_003221 [Puccinia striiformis f. sp. tritici]KAH9472614.1 hypothetical protein Pst134EA_003221 [Puccinia striiformis f. sp. tritici]
MVAVSSPPEEDNPAVQENVDEFQDNDDDGETLGLGDTDDDQVAELQALRNRFYKEGDAGDLYEAEDEDDDNYGDDDKDKDQDNHDDEDKSTDLEDGEIAE